VVFGADDREGLEEIAKAALEWLRGFLPHTNGVHSAESQVVPEDGKTLRGSKGPMMGPARCHLVFQLTTPRRVS
jgi:hypothetical protein